MRKFFLLALFFILAPCTILLCVGILFSQDKLGKPLAENAFFKVNQHVAYAALPPMQSVLGISITTTDRRIVSLQDFLNSYNSPLAPYAGLIIAKADEYGIDYRLLPAIAMQETGLCKKTLPQAPYNCWGWGIWGKRITNFPSYEDAIDTISHYFANRAQNGVNTLDAIGNIYNPGNTNHWKENVALVMSEF